MKNQAKRVFHDVVGLCHLIWLETMLLPPQSLVDIVIANARSGFLNFEQLQDASFWNLPFLKIECDIVQFGPHPRLTF